MAINGPGPAGKTQLGKIQLCNPQKVQETIARARQAITLVLKVFDQALRQHSPIAECVISGAKLSNLRAYFIEDFIADLECLHTLLSEKKERVIDQTGSHRTFYEECLHDPNKIPKIIAAARSIKFLIDQYNATADRPIITAKTVR